MFQVISATFIATMHNLYPVELLSLPLRAKGMGLYGVIQGACGAVEAYGISIGISKVGYKIWCVYIVYNALQLVGESYLCMFDGSGELIFGSIVFCFPGNQQIESGGNRCCFRDTWRCACKDVVGHPEGEERKGQTRQGSRHCGLSGTRVVMSNPASVYVETITSTHVSVKVVGVGLQSCRSEVVDCKS